MTDRNKVVWSEGLFLRTQHLQQQDRHTEWLVRRAVDAMPLQSVGFGRIEIDPVALEAGQVALLAAEAILPDGTFLSVPDHSADRKSVV